MRGSLRGVAFLLFMAALVLRAVTSASQARAFFPPSEFVCLAMAAAAFALVLLSGQLLVPKLPLLLSFAGFAVFYVVAVLRSDVRWFALMQGVCLLQLPLFFWTALCLGRDYLLRRGTTWGVVSVGCAAAFATFWQRFVVLPRLVELSLKPRPQSAFEATLKLVYGRIAHLEAYSFFVLPNMLCALCVATATLLSAAVWTQLHKKEGKGAVVLLVLLAAVVAAGVMSGAKGGWVLLAVAAVVLLFARRWGTKKALFLLVALAVVLLAVSFTPLAEKAPASARVRLLYWRGALQIAASHPLGTGIATFRGHFMPIQSPLCEPVKAPHNAVLLYLAEGGIPLGIAAALILIFLFVAFKTEEPPHTKPDRKALLIMMLGALLGLIVAFYLPFHATILRDSPDMLLLALLALVVVPSILWRFDVGFPIWAAHTAFIVLLGSTLIDFSHLETNFAVLAAVWAGLWVEARAVSLRAARGTGLAVSAAIVVAAIIGFATLNAHSAKVLAAQNIGKEALVLIRQKDQKNKKVGWLLMRKALADFDEAIKEVPSDLLARRFDLTIRHDLWLDTQKGGAPLEKRAHQMLRYWRRYRRAYAVLAQTAARSGRAFDALHYTWQKALLCPVDPQSWAELALLSWTAWRVEMRQLLPPPWAFALPAVAYIAAQKALQLDSLKNLAFKHLTDGQRHFLSAIIKATKR